jgi:hypothetical protein
LAAASSDYRELQDHTSTARTVLLLIGLVYAAVGVMTFLVQSRALGATPEDDALARAALIESIVTAVAFLVCWRTARGAPVLAIAAATFLWLGLQTFAALASPASIFSGLWLKAVAAILLLRGMVAGARAKMLLRKLTKAA